MDFCTLVFSYCLGQLFTFSRSLCTVSIPIYFTCVALQYLPFRQLCAHASPSRSELCAAHWGKILFKCAGRPVSTITTTTTAQPTTIDIKYVNNFMQNASWQAASVAHAQLTKPAFSGVSISSLKALGKLI